MQEAGVKIPFDLVTDDGLRHRNIEAMRWRTGKGTEVVALYGPSWRTWPEPNGPPDPLPAPFNVDKEVPVTVKLPDPRYVYEIRTGRTIGLTTSFKTSVSAFMATLLVVSKDKLHAPTLVATTNAATRGGSLKFRVDIPRSRGGRVLKIRATGPNGKKAPWFANNIIVRNGHALVDLPIAWNELPGPWTVTATDVFTTKATSSVVQVH